MNTVRSSRIMPHGASAPRLPDGIRACLFDLDGVITKTDVQHRQAWKRTFDPFLREYEGEAGRPFSLGDYMRHVDGMPRHEAVHHLLVSRDITLPPGDSHDLPGQGSEHALANRKDELLTRSLADELIEVYPGTLRFVRASRRAGMSTALVSASSHCAQVIGACGAGHLFDTRIDGHTARERRLRGKPAPDSYDEAASELRVAPGEAAVFEDGPTGIEAAVRGRFGWIVAIDRCGRREDLLEPGPDIVVDDLAELLQPSTPHDRRAPTRGPANPRHLERIHARDHRSDQSHQHQDEHGS
ncbi:HAD-IA family hydrolase [Streptomyces cyaneofuscatus]|uniref:HAD family hydrolase n=1 Tax=Streptomyces cyaneofuscatus TaxID=66883 RepID=UPI002955B172|nr:HAD-IA family hydrolase [Streptomyces cyaneofuscatus]WOP09862.1 HAD-IA family hydrolase [Streptomyces cyaneofuscatus]